MKHWVWLIAVVAGCASDDLSTGQVEQNMGDYQAGDYQAGDYQAGDYQAGDYQAGDYQGAHYASSSFSGATLNGMPLQDISISGTTLSVWRKIKASTYPYYQWEQRLPNRICTWFWDKSRATCVGVDPSTSASPLAGVRFVTTLRKQDGTTMTGIVQIGASSSALNAVRQDRSYAMWPLTGINATSNSSTSPNAPVNCTNPAGCRQNTDLWTYDLKLINADGSQIAFCSGQSYALNGVWDSVGKHTTSDTSQFTFACSTGTIAKCTRWGYRPWITSYTKSDGTNVSFADYHQACVRAAMADYCANGHTATKYHTLVDIYDYDGFIPNMSALYPHATAFVWESEFDPLGATQLDFTRYYELAQSSSNGGILAPDPIGCPFSLPIAPADPRDPIHRPFQRAYDTWTSPRINVRSTPVCSHTEFTVGKFLHQDCSGCTMHLMADHPDPTTDYSYCTFPGDPRGWDAGCVWAATHYCGWNATNPNDWDVTMSKMAPTHGECTAGDHLLVYATACTADVCKDPGYESCCTSAWTSSCVTHANEQCRGGQEHNTLTHQYGFCNQVIALQNSL